MIPFCMVGYCSRLQESKIDMSELQLTADQLAEMVSLIEDGTISGKIAKQILPDLLQVGLAGDSTSYVMS